MSTSNQSQIAFENGPDRANEEGRARTTGILPSQEITNLIARGNISAAPAINPDHIQPASLDLRLGDMAHRVRASFLPGPNSTVEAKIKELRMTRVDLTGAPDFEKDCVYIIPLVYMDDEDSPVKARLHRGLRITVNLEGTEEGEIIAYKAKRYAPAIELDRIDYYPTEEFWEVRRQTANKNLILEPDDFYILASRQIVLVPPEFSLAMD